LRSSSVCAEAPAPSRNRTHVADARVFMSFAP
jgi:hypothetical protein